MRYSSLIKFIRYDHALINLLVNKKNECATLETTSIYRDLVTGHPCTYKVIMHQVNPTELDD